MEYIRSPLRYPGGKSRAVRSILSFLPSGLTRLCSPFVGGGSVELACASRGVRVFGYDAFEPLVNFWRNLLMDAPSLARAVERYFPIKRSRFYELQRSYFGIEDSLELAAVFFALNRSSFSGTTLSGGMSPNHPRFTERTIENLSKFSVKDFYVRRADFTESMSAHADDFLYLDPPYANGGKLYGERGSHHVDFDHAALASLLRRRDGWILSYNDCAMVRELYEGFRFVSCEWAYGMNSSKASNEVLIISRDCDYIS